MQQIFLTIAPWRHLYKNNVTRWRHPMETFSALLDICAGNSPVTGEFRAQRPVTRSFDVFFDLRLNKRLSKQWWGWLFETPSHPLWRHYNEYTVGWNFLTMHYRYMFLAPRFLYTTRSDCRASCFIKVMISRGHRNKTWLVVGRYIFGT